MSLKDQLKAVGFKLDKIRCANQQYYLWGKINATPCHFTAKRLADIVPAASRLVLQSEQPGDNN